jgi:hypothetical protein
MTPITRNQPDARPHLHSTTQCSKTRTNIHALGGIRTYDFRVQHIKGYYPTELPLGPTINYVNTNIY